MKSTFLFLATILIVTACKSGAEKKQTLRNESERSQNVIQPIKGLEIEPTVYEVIADIASKVELPNGGSLEIPASAFVNADGKLVKGEVNVEWAEFHSLTDIMLSGIPMKYDSAGVSYNFVSGGMFTINARQNGEELDLAKGKEITVNLVSTDDTPCYNFYELNEETGDWNYETTAVGKPVAPQKVKIEKQTPTLKTTLIDCEVDYSQFKELENKNIVAWSTQEDLSDAELNVIEKQVSLLTLQKDEEGFYLNFKRQKGGKKLRVEPYLLEQAESKSETLKSELKKDLVEVRIAFQSRSNGSFERSMEIGSLGTYNWDCIHRVLDAQPIVANFKFNQDIENQDATKVYYICSEDNLIVQCNSKKEYSFFYSPSKKNVLVAIAPNQEVFILDNAGFDQLRADRTKKEHTFHLKSTGMIAENGFDVEELVKNVL